MKSLKKLSEIVDVRLKCHEHCIYDMSHKYTGTDMGSCIYICKFKKILENFFFLFNTIWVLFPFKVVPRCIVPFFFFYCGHLVCSQERDDLLQRVDLYLYNTLLMQLSLVSSLVSSPESQSHGSYCSPDLFTWTSHSTPPSTRPALISPATPFFVSTVIQIATDSPFLILNFIWEEWVLARQQIEDLEIIIDYPIISQLLIS